MNRILQLFRENFHKKKIYLTSEFFKDITWFQVFLPHFNGTTKFDKPRVQGSNSVCLDACLTGIGAVWHDRVYAAPVPCIPGFVLKIVHWEMLNIVIALRVWGKYWKQSSVMIQRYNEACVHVVATSRTKDTFLWACIRNIWLITAFYDISLQISHIKGKDNIKADALSRLYSNKLVHQEILHDLRNNYIWDNVQPAYFDLNLSL